MLKKQCRILANVKSGCQKQQKYKFDLQVPIDVSRTKKIDNDNENKLRKDAINKEMLNY